MEIVVFALAVAVSFGLANDIRREEIEQAAGVEVFLPEIARGDCKKSFLAHGPHPALVVASIHHLEIVLAKKWHRVQRVAACIKTAVMDEE